MVGVCSDHDDGGQLSAPVPRHITYLNFSHDIDSHRSCERDREQHHGHRKTGYCRPDAKIIGKSEYDKEQCDLNEEYY